jgi:predicted Rossmann-fold nucleotide-binding protein
MGMILHEGTRLGMDVQGHNLHRWKLVDRNEYLYPTLVERQRGLIDSSDMYLVFPGGVGTIYELFQVLCQNDVDRLGKPVILYNGFHFYSSILELLDKLIQQQLVDRERLYLYVVHSQDELWATLSSISSQKGSKL